MYGFYRNLWLSLYIDNVKNIEKNHQINVKYEISTICVHVFISCEQVKHTFNVWCNVAYGIQNWTNP